MSEVAGEVSRQYEYGIVHNQGRASMRSEREALEELPRFWARYESNSRNTTEPYIVRREVGPWVRIHQSAQPTQPGTTP